MTTLDPAIVKMLEKLVRDVNEALDELALNLGVTRRASFRRSASGDLWRVEVKMSVAGIWLTAMNDRVQAQVARGLSDAFAMAMLREASARGEG